LKESVSWSGGFVCFNEKSKDQAMREGICRKNGRAGVILPFMAPGAVKQGKEVFFSGNYPGSPGFKMRKNR
jgi:hypothetical protein